MAVTSFFPIGCMKRQHAVILESIWETDSIITRFPAQRTGLLTPLLTCLTFYFTLLLPFTWTNYSKSNFLSPFFFLDKKFLSPIPLLSPLGQKYFKSNFNSTKIFQDNSKSCHSRNFFRTSQNFSKTIPSSVLAANSFSLRKNLLGHFHILSWPQFHSQFAKLF